MTNSNIKAPSTLAEPTRVWFLQVAADYELEETHLRLLELAGRSWDRAEQARKQIAADGLTTTDRYGQTKPHPAVGIEKDSQLRFARLLREINLDIATPEDDPRTPRIAGRQR